MPKRTKINREVSDEPAEITRLRNLKSEAIKTENFEEAEAIERKIQEARGEVEHGYSRQESTQRQALYKAIEVAEQEDLALAETLRAKLTNLKRTGESPIQYTGPGSEEHQERKAA